GSEPVRPPMRRKEFLRFFSATGGPAALPAALSSLKQSQNQNQDGYPIRKISSSETQSCFLEKVSQNPSASTPANKHCKSLMATLHFQLYTFSRGLAITP